MKKWLILITLIFSTQLYSLTGPQMISIFVDHKTWSEVKNEIISYALSIENQGITTKLEINHFKSPEKIKKILLDTYKHNSNLIGAIFIGDLPIPMITGAQHLTSAYRIDESRVPLYKSAVPSDRFYDDFDLKFIKIKRPTEDTCKDCFYYKLDHRSPQIIRKEIFTSRIKAPTSSDQRFNYIRKFLRKVVNIKNDNHKLSHMLIFTGHGYYSQSINSWTSEHLLLKEQFPNLFTGNSYLKYINYRSFEHPKEMLMYELESPTLDMAIFHAHGNTEEQLLTEFPQGINISSNLESIQLFLRNKLRSALANGDDLERVKKDYIERYKIPISFFDGAFDPEITQKDEITKRSLNLNSSDLKQFAPQAKLIVFDQCYNGAFQKDNYLAGAYLFDDDGKTIAAIANTVNTLQDKWALRYFEKLNFGKMIGEIHKLDNYLEGHLLGDPTFKFTANNSFPDYRASSCFYKLNIIEAKLKNALLLGREGSLIFPALNDSCEILRKFATIWAYNTGKIKYVKTLIKLWLTDESKRIRFQAKLGLGQYDPEIVQSHALSFLDHLPDYMNKNKLNEKIIRFTESNKKWLNNIILKRLKDSSTPLKKRLSAVRIMRNYHFDKGIKFLLIIAKDQNEKQILRLKAVEALGWYYLHKRRIEIISALKTIKSKQINSELIKTLKRLTVGPNVLFTP